MSFAFIHITDHHLPESESILTKGYSTWHAFRAVMRHIAEHNAHRADFIVTTGDLVEKGTDAEYQHFREKLGIRETSPVPGPQWINIEGLHDRPMYFLPGNHDPREAFCRNMFGRSGKPMNTDIVHQDVRFLCLDWGEENKACSTPMLFEFLQFAPVPAMATIILMHHTVVPIGIPRIDSFVPDDVDRFCELMQGRNILGLFCGHTHATYESEIAGIPIFGLRSTTFSFAQQGDELLYVLRPPHYRVVTVADGQLSTEIVEVSV